MKTLLRHFVISRASFITRVNISHTEVSWIQKTKRLSDIMALLLRRGNIMTAFCKHLRNKEAPLYPQGCMLGNATSPLWCEKKERCYQWEANENNSVEAFPMICSKVLEIEILVKRIEIRPGVSIPHIATIAIGHDGSVYMRERIDDPRRNEMDNEMGYGIYHNWSEFKAMDTLDFHPATMIEEWVIKEGISLKWLGIVL
jgi:hypothetical protein